MTSSIWKIWLRPNHLTEDAANDYVAEVSTVGKTLRNSDIALQFAGPGTEMQYETLLDILDRADRIRREKLQEGYSVQTGVCHLSPRISGAWLGATTADAAKHKVTLSITPTAEMRSALADVKIEVLGIREGGEYIGLVTDVTTGLTDGTITPGGQIIISGNRIKVEPADEQNIGVFLTNGTQVYHIAPLAVNHSKEIISILPQLPVGTYSLYINTRYSSGTNLLKEARRIDYGTPLSVIPNGPIED
jgi:hypothetical protein